LFIKLQHVYIGHITTFLQVVLFSAKHLAKE